MPPTQAAAKTERLLNLVICLLYTRRPLRKEQIRAAVPQYGDQVDEAFDRMFERDKEELRALGIPLVTQHLDTFFEDEPGYRIDRREYALPEIEFTPDEAAALVLASRTWSHASLAASAAQALRKLAAAGVERDDASVLGLEPAVRTNEPAFDAVKDAVVDGHPITFSYRRTGADTQVRHVQPWGIANWHGRWYLTAFDVDRGEPRVFRLDRIEGGVRSDGPPGSYEVPADHDPRSVVSRRVGDGDERGSSIALVRVRQGQGHTLRRRARDLETSRDAAVEDHGWSRLELEYTDAGRLAEELCWYGPDVVVLDPPHVRDLVVGRLTGAAHAHTSPDPADPTASHSAPTIRAEQEIP